MSNNSVIPFDRTAIQNLDYDNNAKKEFITKLESSPFFYNSELYTLKARQRLAGFQALSNGSHGPNDEQLVQKILNDKNLKNSLTQSTHKRHFAILKMKQNKIERELKNKSPTNTDLKNIKAKIKTLRTYYNKHKDETSFNENIIKKFENNVKLLGGGKRLIRYGSRGGRYYMKGGNKVYI